MNKKLVLIAWVFASTNVFADKFLVVENNADLMSIYNIDQTTGQLGKQSQGRTLGHGPAGAMISPDKDYLFILNGSSTNIARFNMSDIKNNNFNNGSIVASIGVETWGGSFTPDGKGLLVSATAQNKLDYFAYNKDNGSLTKTNEINLKYCPGGFGMTFAPNTNVMYLNCYQSNTIEKLGYSSASNSYVEQKTIVIGNGYGTKPRGINLDSTYKKAYVSSEGSSSVYVYNYDPLTGDIGALITQINTNFGLLVGTQIDPYGQMIATDRNTGTLNYYKRNSDGIYKDLIRSCNLGKATLGGISFDNNGHMYAITRGDNSITLYNVSADKCPQMIQHLTTTGMPFGLARISD
jgi:6-phosphogluconolactonase (cycloisomerase 2 family)